MTFWNRRLALVAAVIVVTAFVSVPDATADVTGTLLTGSSGTWTFSLNSEIFNNDPAAIGGGNADVTNGTAITFAGCASGVLGSPGCLSVQNGITVNNTDLTVTTPSAANVNTFLTFAANPNLVFSINWPPGLGSPINTNCATANSNGLSCSIFAGSPLVLTFGSVNGNGDTLISLSVSGKASDTGVAGLAAGSNYSGGFSQFFTNLLPDGKAPTPLNIQDYFCTGAPAVPGGGNTCTSADFLSGKSITTAESGTFTATTPATTPEPGTLSLLGFGLLGLGGLLRR